MISGIFTTCNISIHAPVWGRGFYGVGVVVTGNISIHAPVWGRGSLAGMNATGESISIHAPVWGRATRPRGNFNSRPRVGAGRIAQEAAA